MNRTTVLNSINRHLRECHLEAGGLRPLGEIVPRIATELRAGEDTTDIAANIVPIPLVAAFIDGDISEAEEQSVCRSILVDNSVLAELIAGVLANREIELPLPEIAGELSARLFELVAQTSSAEAIGTIEEKVLTANANNAPPQLQPGRAAVCRPGFTAQGLSSKPNPAVVKPPVAPHRTVARAAWTIAIAASIIVAVCWIANRPRSDRNSHVVQIQPNEGLEPNSVAPELSPELDRDQPSVKTLVADLPATIVEPTNAIESNPIQSPMPSQAVLPTQIVDNAASTDKSPPKAMPTPVENIRWNRITGILAMRETEGDYTDELGWRGISTGSEDWANADSPSPMHFLTLPLSRAEADLSKGGKLVIAADTGLSLAKPISGASIRLSLRHGLIALVDIPQGTRIELATGDNSSAVIEWPTSQSTVIFSFTEVGIKAQIDGGAVSIHDRVVKNSMILIEPNRVTELKEKSVKVPVWVTRSIESIPLPKPVLAQIAASDDIAETLHQMMVAEQRDINRLTVLSSLLASLGDSNLLVFAENRAPALRVQALQRLFALPEWDPRYRRSWARFGAAINNEPQLVFLRHVVELTRRGGKLNENQVNQLVNLIESPDAAVRSLSDFILRKSVGGPPVDASLTPRASARLWHRYINAIRNP